MDLAFANRRGSAAQWAKEVRQEWLRSLPEWDAAASGCVNEERVTLSFASGAQACGRYVCPRGDGPFPAVLLLHEHGGAFETGWEKMVTHPSSVATQDKLYEGVAPASTFLDAGFAVLCVDALGWGRRQYGGYDGQQALAANALGLGWSLAGIVASEDAQAAAWLAARPEIDASRIGAFGFSFGGFRAWQVAALSPKISASASLSWMACRAHLMAHGMPLLKGQSAFYMLHPALAGRADFPDLAGLGAHKPSFFRSGRGDPHMPEGSVTAAWQGIAAIAAETGGPAPDTAFHDAAHTCPSRCLDDAIRFLAHHL